MKRSIALSFLVLPLAAFGQSPKTSDRKQIKGVLSTFMNCLIHKDSQKFEELFHDEPTVWIGVFKDKTQQERLSKDSTKKNFFSSNYKSFYKSISDLGSDEEKFYNISIIEDGSIASVNFDYSFWGNKKKINWGKESWSLVKANGQWKITTVIFSLELESINPEPRRKGY